MRVSVDMELTSGLINAPGDMEVKMWFIRKELNLSHMRHERNNLNSIITTGLSPGWLAAEDL